MPNFLDEYLLRLGASIDQSGLNHFHQALQDASKAVDSTALGMASAFLKAQTSIVSGFAAIGGAAIGLADKVAMADQEYRLFALHMFMSKDAARGLKVAMDALGQPLENLAWDPELRARTRQLIQDQRAMGTGVDFEANMRKIRDIRFEFTRLEVEVQYLAMHVVNDFFKALGLGPDDLLKKLRQINAWVIEHMPEISQHIVNDFMPVWHDVRNVLMETGAALEELGLAFTNIVGLFSGDTSIMGATFNFEHFAQAIGKVVHVFALLAQTLAEITDLIGHLVSALALAATGKFGEAGEELKASLKDINARTVMAGLIAGSAFLAPEAIPAEAEAAEAAEAAGAAGTAADAGFFERLLGGVLNAIKSHPIVAAGAGAAVGGKLEGDNAAPAIQPTLTPQSLFAPTNQQSRSLPATSAYRLPDNVWEQVSNFVNRAVSPELLKALAKVESGALGMSARSPAGAIGIMQLEPKTAAAYGVDPTSLAGNLQGAAMLLRDLLKHYGGNVADAIGAYNAGQPRMDAFLAGKATLPNETRNEIARVLALMGKTGSVQVGSVVINIPHTNASPQDIQQAVTRGMSDAMNKRTQRNLSEFQSPAWSY